MSLSINNYYNKKYYDNYDLTSGSTSAARKSAASNQEASSSSLTDAADFSEIAKLFFNLEGTDDAGEDEYTELYSPASLGSAAGSQYGGDMKSLLAQIQLGLGLTETDSATGVTGESGSSLGSLQSLLGSNGLSSLSGDGLFSLVQSVTSDSSAAGYAGINSLDTANETTGLPAMLQAMGGFPPPLGWSLDSQDNSDSSVSTDSTDRANTLNGLTSLEAGLTSEDMMSVLAQLQRSLGASASSSSTADSSNNPLAAVQTMLSAKNFSTMTNIELSSLFGKVLGTLA
ncbi:hypothetical protein MKX70_13345 [Paenibacillus sp. FSL R7-0312]|uniref:hypothetical protein n=1 Tax=Paenibacillus sp. FSL R7-0312 TaxID=2921682 RepID=UPI0030FAF54D